MTKEEDLPQPRCLQGTYYRIYDNPTCSTIRCSSTLHVVLTDVVVLVSWPELEAQAEGGEQLELLGELERPVGALRAVTLPALESLPAVVAGGVAVVVHHVQHVLLHALVRLRPLVVRTVDVQVVVDGHLHRVLAPKEPEEGGGRSDVIPCLIDRSPIYRFMFSRFTPLFLTNRVSWLKTTIPMSLSCCRFGVRGDNNSTPFL